MSDRMTPQQLADYAALDFSDLMDPDAAAVVGSIRDQLVGEIKQLREERTKYVLVPKWEYELLEQQRARAEKAETERDALQERLHDAAMAKVWTNEDRKKFVFVEDIAPALLGLTPGAEVGR